MKKFVHKYSSQLSILCIFFVVGVIIFALDYRSENTFEATFVKDGVSTPVHVTMKAFNHNRLFGGLVQKITGHGYFAEITLSADSWDQPLLSDCALPLVRHHVEEDSRGPAMYFSLLTYYDPDRNELDFAYLYQSEKSMKNFFILGEGWELWVGENDPSLLRKVEQFRGEGEHLQQPE